MRRNLASIIALIVALLLLTACRGADESSTDPAGVAKRQAGSARSLPSERVCDVLSKKKVGLVIGRAIFSVSDLNGSVPEPSVCTYYFDSDEIDGVYIQWMTIEQSLWGQLLHDLGSSPAGDSAQIDAVQFGGDDAIKASSTTLDQTTVLYWVRLDGTGLVLKVQDLDLKTGVPDSRLRELTKVAVKAAKQL